MFPNLVKFSAIPLSLPLTNAWPERDTSTLKRVKARLCSLLKDNMLDSLAFVNGPWPSIYMLQVNSWVLHLLQNLMTALIREQKLHIQRTFTNIYCNSVKCWNHWINLKLLLTRQPSHINRNRHFNHAIRLYYTNLEVANISYSAFI